MHITVLQMDIVWGCAEENIRNAQRLMDQSPGCDLYLLPEMWSTGFATSPEGIADQEDIAISWMIQQAIDKCCAICGSVSIVAEGYRNRTFFVYPDGSYLYYDKHHLFGYGGEKEHYVAGDSRTVVEYMGLRWLLVTCYDIRFPIWCRYRGDYDGILVTASWPSTRRPVWDVLLRARAIENQCYVVASNRVGTDPHCEYNGGSMVIDAKGQVLAQCEDGREAITTAEISIESLRQFREKFRVLYDRDKI